MTGSWKTAILPFLAAALLYILLSFVLLPIYRRYRADIARYSQYAPLTSTLQSTTSIFGEYIPDSLRPRSIKERIGDFLLRIVIPFMFRIRSRGSGDVQNGRGNRNGNGRGSLDSDDDDDDDGGLFDEESGERMVGFDMNEERRGRSQWTNSRLGNQRQSHALQAALEHAERSQEEDHSDRRLSRELEEGFIDDSESERSDEEVTVGRRRVSMSVER